MSEIWEPWQPEVGDRVRVLARPECFYCREDHDAEVGATGVVSAVHPPKHLAHEQEWEAAQAHRYWVHFDDSTIVERTVAGVIESHFAAAELVPVDG